MVVVLLSIWSILSIKVKDRGHLGTVHRNLFPMMNNLDSVCARVESARRDRLRKVVLRRENIIKNSAPYSFIFYRRTFSSPTFPEVRYYMSLSKWFWKVITSSLKYTDLIWMTKENKKKTFSKEGVWSCFIHPASWVGGFNARFGWNCEGGEGVVGTRVDKGCPARLLDCRACGVRIKTTRQKGTRAPEVEVWG